MMSNWIKRKETSVVNVGGVPIGGDNPIAIQSMTNTNTLDVLSTVNQINELQAAGADIVRVSVPGIDEANAFKEIKSIVTIPLVADIHFDYKIAIEAVSYTHLRAHETRHDLVCRLLLEKKKNNTFR